MWVKSLPREEQKVPPFTEALSLCEATVLKGITHPNNHSVLKECYKVGIITSILHLKQLMQDSCLV